MSRFRKVMLILSILTVIFLTGLYLGARAYLSSDRTRRQVESQLAEVYGGPVAVDSASVGMVSDSSFHGVRLYEAGASEPAPWAVFESVQTDVSALDILRGKTPQVDTLTGADITLTFDRDGKLLTRLPETKSKGGNFPTIHVEQAKVTLRQEGRPEMVVSGVQAELRPQDGQLTLSGTISDDYWGRWSLDGKVDTAASSLTATLKTGHADVTQDKLDRLPVIPKSVWDVVNAAGPTPVEFTYRHESGAKLPDRYTVVLNPDGATIDIKERDKENYGVLIPGRDVRGRIVIEDGEVRLEGIRCSAFGGTIQTDANLDFRGKETKLDFYAPEIQRGRDRSTAHGLEGKNTAAVSQPWRSAHRECETDRADRRRGKNNRGRNSGDSRRADRRSTRGVDQTAFASRRQGLRVSAQRRWTERSPPAASRMVCFGWECQSARPDRLFVGATR